MMDGMGKRNLTYLEKQDVTNSAAFGAAQRLDRAQRCHWLTGVRRRARARDFGQMGKRAHA
jgi:hypothetical protein